METQLLRRDAKFTNKTFGYFDWTGHYDNLPFFINLQVACLVFPVLCLVVRKELKATPAELTSSLSICYNPRKFINAFF